jgi:hypothetical protein
LKSRCHAARMGVHITSSIRHNRQLRSSVITLVVRDVDWDYQRLQHQDTERKLTASSEIDHLPPFVHISLYCGANLIVYTSVQWPVKVDGNVTCIKKKYIYCSIILVNHIKRTNV